MESLVLLVSDVDGTLLGDEKSLDDFRSWFDRYRSRVLLAYSSGRFIGSIRATMQEERLPEPDAIIGGVGTEILDLRSGRRLTEWPELVSRWDAEKVKAVCRCYSELIPQPDVYQSEYKVSYFGRDLDQRFLVQLEEHLKREDLRVRVIYSSFRDLDILPEGIDKGSSIAFLTRHWELNDASVVVAGDSGNDRSMFERGFPGIVVGNAQAELKSMTDGRIYHATAHYAGGVLEGMRHWWQNIP